MKYILKTAFILAIGFCFSSCEDLLPPVDKNNTLEEIKGELEGTDLNSNLSKSLEQNIKFTTDNINQSIANIAVTSADKPRLKPISIAANSIPGKIESFCNLVDDICNEIRSKTENLSTRTNSKSISQKILFDYNKATQLKELLLNMKRNIHNLLDDLVEEQKREPMAGVDLSEESISKLKEKLQFNNVYVDNWEKDHYSSLGASAAYLLLRKQHSEIKNTALEVVNYLSKQMGNIVTNYDNLPIVSIPFKPVVLLGESYETEIVIGEPSDQAEFTVSVNGASLKLDDNGQAKYTTRPSSVGQQSYTAKIIVVNPLTNETESFKKDFHYTVGVPSISTSADQMNILYVGVDNPISVAASGISSNDLDVRISGAGGSLKNEGRSRYSITVSQGGQDCIVSIWNKRTNKKITSIPFQVKKCPNPAILLDNKKGGVLKAGQMIAQEQLSLAVENFDFDIKCEIQSFTLVHIPKRQDAIKIQNTGANFSGKGLQAIKAAKAGDSYQFINVKGRCAGDTAPRQLSGLAFIVR